jgi:hypothetical protein
MDFQLGRDVRVRGAAEYLRVHDVRNDRLVFARKIFVQQFCETIAGNLHFVTIELAPGHMVLLSRALPRPRHLVIHSRRARGHWNCDATNDHDPERDVPELHQILLTFERTAEASGVPLASPVRLRELASELHRRRRFARLEPSFLQPL